MVSSGRFQWPDYVVLSLSLLTSASIGIYFAIHRRRETRSDVTEYLMGGRKMGFVPVAVSLVVSFCSAVAILGLPAEIYSFGVQVYLMILGCAVALTLAAVFYLPVYHKLQLTSIYEYLDLRFDRRVRWLCSALNLITMLLYSSIALYAPSIAISQVTGMSQWLCVLLSGILTTFYTTLGGFKSVLWTDTLQACFIVLGLLSTLIKGSVDAGGMSNVMNISAIGGRRDMSELAPNLFSRHNLWGWLFGELFLFLGMYATSQFAAQRFCSVASVQRARMSLLAGIPLYAVILGFAMSIGLVAFAYYYGCDPVTSGKMSRRDQILPAFVIDVFEHNPGMPGLLISAILCAALSTLSTVQHSFAAVLLQDVLEPVKFKMSGKPFTDRQGTVLSQITVLLVGAVIVALAIGVAGLGKTVLRLAASTMALSAGPSLGVFTVGLFCNFANTLGALSGMAVSFVMLGWIIVGSVLHPHSDDKPLPLFNHLCPKENNTLFTTMSWMNTTTTPSIYQREYSGLSIYRLSYRYHVFLGTVMTILVCCIVSLLTGGWSQRHQVPRQALFSWREHGPHRSWVVSRQRQKHIDTENIAEHKSFRKDFQTSGINRDQADVAEELILKNNI